jgi:hypothetical protein
LFGISRPSTKALAIVTPLAIAAVTVPSVAMAVIHPAEVTNHTYSACLTQLNSLINIHVDSTSTCAVFGGTNGEVISWSAQGPKGDTGETGATGAQGPAGDTGATGDTGPAGPTGPAGDTGPAGPAGDTGPAGPAGDTGPAGPAGDTGPAGPAGDTGPAGPAGDIGPAGPAGPTGDIGPAGPAGATGAAGANGDTGPAGPAGATGAAGANGDIGPAGPAGATGAAGANGTNGVSGFENNRQTFNVAKHSTAIFTVSCSGGKAVTGGGAWAPSSAVGVLSTSPAPTASGWTVRVQNSGGVTHSVSVYALCASV